MNGNTIPFVKMNGAGNKIIVADMRGQEAYIASEAAIELAKAENIPFDQLMEIRDPKNPADDVGIRILNSDGSEAQACGNGTRCVVTFLNEQSGQTDFKFRTRAGQLLAQQIEKNLISVDMGMPRFGWEEIPTTEEFADTTKVELQIGPIDAPVLHSPSLANMGNPHAVFWVDEDVNSYDLHLFGPLLENHPIFPERANITIANVQSAEHIIIRTWERGAGLTLACGSASCATLVSAVRKGFTNRKAAITGPGGELTIEWAKNNHVIMTGPTEHEFSGLMDPMTGSFSKSA